MPNSKSSHLDPAKILESVRPTPVKPNQLSEAEKIDKIAKNFREIMETLGLDLNNDSLSESPQRVAKMYVQEYFSGLQPENFPRITLIENEMLYDQMVVVKDIKVLSCCEHHFVTIHGVAHIAYIPSHGVVGLSKINRIADYFSRRPQVQERLTKQIADCLAYILKTDDVAVFIKAKHYCVISRGVEDVNSETITSDLRGAFKTNPETRSEFLSICR